MGNLYNIKMASVFILKTKPESVVNDYGSLLEKTCPEVKDEPIILKLNLSWTRFYPGCSTPPWELEGVLKYLTERGVCPENILPVENRTVVTNVQKGSANNKWLGVLEKYGVKMRYLTDEEYVEYKPKHTLLVMGKVFHNHIMLPRVVIGKPIIHLPTMKMHVFTTTTGAIKNYFGMLRTTRHFAHRYIHETIVDLLSIQREIHPAIYSVMDGTTVGSGSGPRAMKWEEKSLILGSDDPVSIDAVAAKIMGFEPLSLDYIRLANEAHLGNGDLKSVDVRGEDIEKINFHYKRADTFASRGQKLIYRHLPEAVEKVLLQSPLVPWSYFASNFYHDFYWYNIVGKKRVEDYLKTEWGKLFLNY